MATLVTFSCAWIGFTTMHAVVLATLAWLSRAAGRPAVRVSTRAADVLQAVQYVSAEAAMLCVALRVGAVDLAAPTTMTSVVSPAAAVAWWELWFYVGHRLLHLPGLYVLHRPHHAREGLHPSLCFGAGETAILSAGFYAPFAFLARLGHPVPLASVAVTLVVAYVLNALSHLDESPLGEAHETSPLRHFWNSPRYHAHHHGSGRGNYALISPWLDRAFGTALTAAPRQAQRSARRALRPSPRRPA